MQIYEVFVIDLLQQSEFITLYSALIFRVRDSSGKPGSRSVGFENPTPRLPGVPLLSLTQGMFCHSDTAFSKMLFYLIDQNYQGTAKYPQNSNSAQD